MLIKLKGTNKKLLQQCGANECKANIALVNDKENLFHYFNDKANAKLKLIGKNLGVCTEKFLVSPGKSYSHLVVIKI
ncbi:hypothetical protein KTC96_25045 (plasmid) [Clostridium estertheticum]|uniref:hypothetical protein n=1 Tax=Clostridium estertheticum TaxID=238834 RepID=UPI001C7DDB45|nr:hypothetical protein [Clostridium estertheticum]MBX4259796.1 hypothetical protein [Clostridium estertheticum]WLC73288.1 hypothetical protein KTC96_25045 [Clostridium estertheticum]